MGTILRTTAGKEFERTVSLNKRPNRVFTLFEKGTEKPLGVMLKWFPDEWPVSPIQYFTPNGGETFQHVSNYMHFPSGIEARIEDRETRPEILIALRALLAAWRESFGTAHS